MMKWEPVILTLTQLENRHRLPLPLVLVWVDIRLPTCRSWFLSPVNAIRGGSRMP